MGLFVCVQVCAHIMFVCVCLSVRQCNISWIINVIDSIWWKILVPVLITILACQCYSDIYKNDDVHCFLVQCIYVHIFKVKKE